MPNFLSPLFNGAISPDVGLFALVIVAIAALYGFRRGDWGKNFVLIVIAAGGLVALFTLGVEARRLGMIGIVILVVIAVFGLPRLRLPDLRAKRRHETFNPKQHQPQQRHYRQNQSRPAHPPAIPQGGWPQKQIGSLNNLSRKLKALGQSLEARGKDYNHNHDEEEWR